MIGFQFSSPYLLTTKIFQIFSLLAWLKLYYIKIQIQLWKMLITLWCGLLFYWFQTVHIATSSRRQSLKKYWQSYKFIFSYVRLGSQLCRWEKLQNTLISEPEITTVFTVWAILKSVRGIVVFSLKKINNRLIKKSYVCLSFHLMWRFNKKLRLSIASPGNQNVILNKFSCQSNISPFLF